MLGATEYRRKKGGHLPARLHDPSSLTSADFLSKTYSADCKPGKLWIQTCQLQPKPGKRHWWKQQLKVCILHGRISQTPFSLLAPRFLEARLLPNTPGRRLENPFQGKLTKEKRPKDLDIWGILQWKVRSTSCYRVAHGGQALPMAFRPFSQGLCASLWKAFNCDSAAIGSFFVTKQATSLLLRHLRKHNICIS